MPREYAGAHIRLSSGAATSGKASFFALGQEASICDAADTQSMYQTYNVFAVDFRCSSFHRRCIWSFNSSCVSRSLTKYFFDDRIRLNIAETTQKIDVDHWMCLLDHFLKKVRTWVAKQICMNLISIFGSSE